MSQSDSELAAIDAMYWRALRADIFDDTELARLAYAFADHIGGAWPEVLNSALPATLAQALAAVAEEHEPEREVLGDRQIAIWSLCAALRAAGLHRAALTADHRLWWDFVSPFDQEHARRRGDDREREVLQTLTVDSIRNASEFVGVLGALATRCSALGAQLGRRPPPESPMAKARCVLEVLNLGLVDSDDALNDLWKAARPRAREEPALARPTGLAFQKGRHFGDSLCDHIADLQAQGLAGFAAAESIANWEGWRHGPAPHLHGLVWGHRKLAPRQRPAPPRVTAEQLAAGITQDELDSIAARAWERSVGGWCEENFDTGTSPVSLARSLLRTLGVGERDAGNWTADWRATSSA